MRRFFIENETGQRFDLNNADGSHIFLRTPTGLGVTMKPSFADLQDGFYSEVSDNAQSQNTIACDLVFTGSNAYRDYRAFTDWVTAAQSLQLVYLPYGETEYFRSVKLKYMTKTELTAGRWLIAPVSFSCLSPWYRATPTKLTLSQESDSVLRYSFSYTPTLVYCSSRAGSMTAELPPGGHIPAAFELGFTGEMLNPTVALHGADTGRLYGRCAITDTFYQDESLLLSTRYSDSFVRKETRDREVIDLLDKVNLANNPFPRVPLDESCYLSLTAENSLSGVGLVKLYYYYRSV